MKAIVFHLCRAALIAAALLILRGERPVPPPAARATDKPPVGYANPAAIYCTGLGYSYEIQHKPTGDVGICKLPDSSVCDEWDFLAGRCGTQYSICARNGYATESRMDGRNPYGNEYAVCVDQAGEQVATAAQLGKLEEKSTKTGCTQSPPMIIEQDDAAPEAFVGTLPSAFDWRSQPKGSYVTNVRDQGQCGSCWAFSAVGVTEAALNILNDQVGNNYNLAEQYLVSGCSGAGTCCGGWTESALRYIRTAGIPDEACLPYVDGDYPSGCQCYGGSCSANCAYHGGGQCSDRTCGNRCTNYTTRLVRLSSMGWATTSPDTIKNLLMTKGPLSVTLSMGGYWNGDVYQCSAGAMVDHAVMLVGYDDAGGYWIVKNSWGSTWNGDGYFKVGYGQCSIENDVYYATVASTVPVPQKPTGTITDRTPKYAWKKVAGATQYQYQLLRGSTAVYTQTVGSSVCVSSVCSSTPTALLSYSSYTWRVRAYVNGVWKAYSTKMVFSIPNPNIPKPQAPGGTLATTTPTYTWTKVVGATQYRYQLVNGGRIVYTRTVSSDVCDGTGICSNTPLDVLSTGSYSWRVRALKSGAWRPYSGYLGFAVP